MPKREKKLMLRRQKENCMLSCRRQFFFRTYTRDITPLLPVPTDGQGCIYPDVFHGYFVAVG